MLNNVQIFDDMPVRRVWDDSIQEWRFSIVDVIAILTGSTDPAHYWRVLKQRLKTEGSKLPTA